MSSTTRAAVVAMITAAAIGLCVPTARAQYGPSSTAPPTSSTCTSTSTTTTTPEQELEDLVVNAEPEQVEPGGSTTVAFDEDVPAGTTCTATTLRARQNAPVIQVDDVSAAADGSISYTVNVPAGTEP